jgi:hypothetical protein
MEHTSWKQSAHSCDNCRRIEFRITGPPSTGPLPFPYQDVFEYAMDGCGFFERTLHKFDPRPVPSSSTNNLELHLSLTWIDEKPMLHHVYISWMLDGIELFEEDELGELHAFTPRGKPSFTITCFNPNGYFQKVHLLSISRRGPVSR